MFNASLTDKLGFSAAMNPPTIHLHKQSSLHGDLLKALNKHRLARTPQKDLLKLVKGVPSADILKRLATSKDPPLAPRMQRFLTVTAADTADSIITFLNLPTAASFNHITDLPTAYAYLTLPQHHILALLHSLKEELLFLIGAYSFIAASHESLKSERNAIHTYLPSHSDWLTHKLRWSAYGYKSFAKMAIPVAEKLGAATLLLRMDSLSYQRAPHLSDLLVYNDDIVGPAILPLAGKGSFDTAIRDHVLKLTRPHNLKGPFAPHTLADPTILNYNRAPKRAPPRGFTTPPDSGEASEVREHEAPEGPNSTPPEELLDNTLRDRISPNRTPTERMRTTEPRPTPSFRTTAVPGSDAPRSRLTIFLDQWRSTSRSIFNIIKKDFHWTWQSQAPQLCTPIHLDSTPNPFLSLADFLFIHPKSFKPLKAGRLSYWLAQAIKIGDPQAIRPVGHDIRKVGHSIAAFRKSTPCSILENGFWHNASVFVRKYLISCRPTTMSFVAGRSITSS
ncbi:hypothetical protein E2C01_001805 [Portunus trituberculatus]|uniref:Uncharacterized protein n=1 Tax=Portunus trituberculatus TaxID=210409 RepID=A0A5B7CNF9_PORTR|nr:hypothetical protein [Portunus trituberculatus]